MNKQITFALLVAFVGAVACQDERAEAIKNGLVDLAIIGAKGVGRAAMDAKPTIDALRSTVEQTQNSLKHSALDLAFIGAKNAAQIAQEAGPTVDALGKSINEGAQAFQDNVRANLENNKGLMDALNAIKEGKPLEHAQEALAPLAASAQQQAANLRPFFEEGMKNAIPLLQQAGARGAQLLKEAEARGRQLMAEHEARQAALKH